VVLVYYEGGETLNERGQFLWTDPLVPRQRAAINRNDLLVLNEVPGAHLLLLDVARAAAPVAARPPADDGWFRTARAGVMRYAWLAGSPVPSDVRLIAALAKAMPRGSELQEVAADIHQQYNSVLRLFPQLTYDVYVPEPLQSLVISAEHRD
jgi:hypothetical protein